MIFMTSLFEIYGPENRIKIWLRAPAAAGGDSGSGALWARRQTIEQCTMGEELEVKALHSGQGGGH